MPIKNNIKSVIKYSGYSELVSVRNKLLSKGRLFSVKVKDGYCFFQEAGSVFAKLKNGTTRSFYYVIFYECLRNEIPRKFDFLTNEKYFYRTSISKKEIEALKNANGKKMIWNRYFFDLGLQKLPLDLKPQRYFRSYDWNPHSNKIHQYLTDVFCAELFEYKEETEEYLTYSSEFPGLNATINDLENGFQLEKWNLEVMKENAEKYYLEHPYDRPTEASYEELKLKIPTIMFKQMYAGNESKLEVVEKIEQELIAYSNELVQDGKPTMSKAKNLTKEIILTLNQINLETDFIETVEREELYAYIAKLLAKLKKVSVIEIIDEYREW